MGDHGFFVLTARTFWSGTVCLVPAVPHPRSTLCSGGFKRLQNPKLPRYYGLINSEKQDIV